MKRKISFRNTAFLLLFNLFLSSVVFLIHRSPVISNLENAFVDLRYWLRGAATPDPRICIVAIDNPSIRELGLFPWPRRRHAQLIDTLTAAGAQSIAFDLFFSERDPDHPDDDAVLGQSASASGRVVFAVMFNRSPDGQPTDPILPVPDLQRDNVGVGLVNIFPEKDGATRRAPLWVGHNDALIPSFALAAWSAAEGKPPEEWVAHARPPVDGRSAWNEACINYTYWRDNERARSPFPYYSYSDVLAGRVAPSTFAGRIVLVGATAPGLYDAKSAPGAPVIYGIEIHANVLNNILRNNFLKARATSGPLLWVLVSVFAVAAWLLMSRSSSFVGGASAVAVFVGYFYVCHLAFRHDVWMPYAAPMTAFLLSYLSGLGYRLFVADRDREKIKNTWSRYMSPKLVDLLVEGQTVPTAGHREVTVFFSDLAKFTSLSEQLPPSELVELLNHYFSMMTDILFKYDITFDKYIGDAIMGYGNAPLDQPDHAVQACRAALAQRAALPGLNKKFADRGWPALRFRVGLNTGMALYGDLGSYTRSNYTVMGDTVNLASRLEGVNKLFGTDLIMSETTFAAANKGVDGRELDFLRVEGKKQPIRVYELVALKDDCTPAQRHGFSIFADALRLYRERRFDLARAEFVRVREILPEDRPSAVYVDRCDHFLATPPPADWDGVYVMTSK